MAIMMISQCDKTKNLSLNQPTNIVGIDLTPPTPQNYISGFKSNRRWAHIC